jgi:hypothetical protein
VAGIGQRAKAGTQKAQGRHKKAQTKQLCLFCVFLCAFCDRSRLSESGYFEVDEPTFGIGMGEPDLNRVADIHMGRVPLDPQDFALDFERRYANPRPAARHAGDDAVEQFSDALMQQNSGGALLDMTLDFISGVQLRSVESLSGSIGKVMTPV